MSRIYSAEEFEEEIMRNNPKCYIPLSQLADLEESAPKEVEEEDDEGDGLEELRVKALFQKLNPHPEVPGQLTKPEPLFYDAEIRNLIEETRLMGARRGEQNVVYNAPPPPPPEEPTKPLPKKKQKSKGKKKPPRANEVIEINSSPEVEIVEETKKFSKLVINPAAIMKTSVHPLGPSGPSGSSKVRGKSSTLPADKSSAIVISSSNEEINVSEQSKKSRKLKKTTFYSPKELYEMKKKLESQENCSK
ncbi:protein piccolo-like [Lutzomyia longipalpis]|uniref:Uncharacterized protein n=1 Tax=Lutzomyia longipalpis TaxID=7200 RepID=A0A1B0CK64_LUTLO|nr:protein piccolo-like [Lutzomyia longipalpis]XP_055679077.1 protein piccolo-like [Lutzomyia longipalpis]